MKVFISYCTSDGLEFAINLKQVLEADGHSPFIYQHDVPRGSLVWDAIGKAIRESDATIILTTPETSNSFGQQVEYNASLNHKIPTFAFAMEGSTIYDILYAFRFEKFTKDNFSSKCKKISSDLPIMISQYSSLEKELIDEIPARFPEQRIETISTFNERTEGLDKDLVGECEKAIMTGYLNSTIIREITSILEYHSESDNGEPFFQIGKRFRVPKSWFTTEKNVNSRPFFSSIGQGIALGERNFFRHHLLKQMKENVKVYATELDFGFINKETLRLKEEGFNPNILLAPIDCYVEIMKSQLKSFEWAQGKTYYRTDHQTRLMVFWSNKYVNLEEFIIMDSNAGIWSIKPDLETSRVLTARIGNSRLYPDEVEVLVKTVAKYEIVKPEGISIIRAKGI